MKKKKIIIVVSVCLCMCLIAAGVFILQTKKDIGNEIDSRATIQQVKAQFTTDIQELKDGKYPNLLAVDFMASIEGIEEVYHLEILEEKSMDDKSNLEQFYMMGEVIDKFFDGEFDKSFLIQEIYYEDKVQGIETPYFEAERILKSEKSDSCSLGFLYSRVDAEQEYFIEIGPGYRHAWFSKRTFNTSLPGGVETDREYLYVTGIRQAEPVINLMDGEIRLAVLEEKALDYVNGEKFPFPIAEGISYGIGTTYIMDYEDCESINFVLRRIYKGIPFEYGSVSASGEYIDKNGHDYAILNYALSISPDTLMGFDNVKGIIQEKEKITEMLTAKEALSLLSKQIGANSVYEVQGVELVYRNCEIPIERMEEVSDILEPKWKIITINQNDDKYTLFYVDVVTGEITERFEYYYD